MAGDDERKRSRQNDRKRPGEERERKRLNEHRHAEPDQHGRRAFAIAATQQTPTQRNSFSFHLRTAPKVMPRSRCLRSTTVKKRIGSTNSVVAAATAGQSCPPSPMMNGMNGGIVCASPLVSSNANAYSFHAKIRQKIAVAAMPVIACGNTTLMKACMRV